MVVTDPVWSQEPADHNTFPFTDLTELPSQQDGRRPRQGWRRPPFHETLAATTPAVIGTQ